MAFSVCLCVCCACSFTLGVWLCLGERLGSRSGDCGSLGGRADLGKRF